MAKERRKLTTASGQPVADDQNTMTAGAPGPALMQDVHLMEKLAHFNRERVPERVVHAVLADDGVHRAAQTGADEARQRRMDAQH